MSIEKENCTTCFHFKYNTCRNHGYYWKDHIAKRTRCDNWKERVVCPRCKSTDLEKTLCEEMMGVVPVHSDLYECKCGTSFWLYWGLEEE